jgi:hypothetical protein
MVYSEPHVDERMFQTEVLEGNETSGLLSTQQLPNNQ